MDTSGESQGAAVGGCVGLTVGPCGVAVTGLITAACIFERLLKMPVVAPHTSALYERPPTMAVVSESEVASHKKRFPDTGVDGTPWATLKETSESDPAGGPALQLEDTTATVGEAPELNSERAPSKLENPVAWVATVRAVGATYASVAVAMDRVGCSSHTPPVSVCRVTDARFA